MIKLGSQDVTKVMKGTQEVSAVYRGSDEVWSAGGDTVDLQLIAGGGGSESAYPMGAAYGAGGGGGFREELGVDVEKNVQYDITVAAGGAVGATGGTTKFEGGALSFVVDGGAGYGRTPTTNGGSGSGGRGSLNSGKNGTAGGLYGQDGGKGGGSPTSGAGGAGGGAGAKPEEAAGGIAVTGGSGLVCFDNAKRAGGGGGSNATQKGVGNNGGGAGGLPGGYATQGTAYTGGGAGATCPDGTQSCIGANGGSGVVFIKSKKQATVTNGQEVSNPNGDGYLYKFESSGSIKF